MASLYLQNLLSESHDICERYLQKLKLIGSLDPFTLKVEYLDFSIDRVLPVSNMGIVSYLILTHSYYTKRKQSLQCYKYFEAGFVTKVGVKVVKDLYILVDKVRHSQRANLRPLDVWSIIAQDESILYSTLFISGAACEFFYRWVKMLWATSDINATSKIHFFN